MATASISTVPKFTPTQIANCALWLDASDPATCLKSGSSVTNWNDKSGNGKNITIGGSGGLSFSNASGNIGAANSVNTVSGRTSYFTTAVDLRKTTTPNMSVFIVYAWLGAGGGASSQVFWGNDVPNNNNRVQFFDFAVFSSASYGYNLNNGLLTNTTELNKSTTQIYEAISQTGVTNGTGVYFNGTLGSAGVGTEVVNTPVTGNETLYFGGGETTSIYPSYTQFNEIIIYSTALTTSQRQQIEGYLAWKWNLVSLLSATHPYKTAPPYPAGLTVPTPMTTQLPALNAPLQVNGVLGTCVLWLDAADQSTLTLSGSTVTGWRDKSGLNTAVTAYGTPTANVTINSVPAINLTNGRFLGYYQNGFLNFRTTTFVVTLLVSYPGEGYSCVAYSPTFGTAPSPYRIVRGLDYAASTYRTVEFDGTNAYVANVARTGLSTPFLWSSLFNGTSYDLQAYLNGGAATSSTTGASMGGTTAYYITIGAIDYDNGTNAWPGYVGEIISYAGVLSTAQRQYVEGYLAWKWGLVGNLPSNHPYKNPPFLPFSYGVPRPAVQINQQLWSPTKYAGCLIWLDAADTSTITGTTTVTGWTNKGTVSVSANNTGNGAAGTCSSGSITQNGRNVLRCPAGSSLSITFASPNQARAWFIVAKNTTQMSPSVLYWAAVNQRQGSGQDNPFGPGVYVSGGNTYTMASGPSGIAVLIASTTAPEPYNVMNVYTWQVSAATTALNTTNVNGTSIPLTTNLVASGYRTDSVAYSINTPGYNTGADICEILFYNTEMTIAQRQNVEGYLAWKWGLQASLPATHPWKLYPPPS